MYTEIIYLSTSINNEREKRRKLTFSVEVRCISVRRPSLGSSRHILHRSSSRRECDRRPLRLHPQPVKRFIWPAIVQPRLL